MFTTYPRLQAWYRGEARLRKQQMERPILLKVDRARQAAHAKAFEAKCAKQREERERAHGDPAKLSD